MIRSATPADAAVIAAIYNHYVAATTVTFEEEPVTADDMAVRIATLARAGLPWLVIEQAGAVAGYAYASKWRERSAYRFSVESTVYLHKDRTGRGLGALVYAALLDELRERELRTVIAGIALPNQASVSLHERLGFAQVARFKEVGRKFDRWADVGYWQLAL
jgi:phosphinothricin acetyltransferase